MNKRLISIVVAVLMVLTLTPYIYAESTVTGGSRITSNGTYQVDPSATGTISIDAGKIVTLVGSGTDAEANQELSIQCGEGANLTLKDLCITNNSDLNILDFTGTGNVLKASGTNVLESIAYTPKAAIHVGPDADLSFQNGGGVLYLYKRTQGSGIGSDAEEANGAITFDGGTWFIKGTKTGAVIGNDTCGDAEKEAQIGDITINGGELYVEANARGAAIGGSNMSAAGNVNMTGGLVTIYNDYSASSIGAGQSMLGTAEKNGTLTVTGGSLKLYLTRNGSAAWGTEMGLNDITLKAAKTNGNGSTPIYKYALDVSGASSPYTVKVDNKDYYSGSGHDYEFTPDTSSTTANWTKKSEDQQLYLYLPVGEHTVSVNGAAQTITVKETEYATVETPAIPEESWAADGHYDTTWYNRDQTEFTLNTNKQLAGLATIVNEGTDTFKDKTLYLGADIDLSAYEWAPVAEAGTGEIIREDIVFEGTFDGNGYEISGLYFYDYDPRDPQDPYESSYVADQNAGLFGMAKDATFRNVNIASGYIYGTSCLSGVCGSGEGCSFINCENHADVTAKYKEHNATHVLGNYAGGICGYSGTYFENCVNYGTINGNNLLGGIVGTGGSDGCVITSCVNYGDVSIGWSGGAGGIVCSGRGTLTVINSANYGAITAGIGEAGGICAGAGAHSSITGCVNGGRISGQNAGGIIAYVSKANASTAYDAYHGPAAVITDCYNTGAVESWLGYRYAGGAGGILGNQDYTTQNVYISNCYSVGEIICDASENENGASFASGISNFISFKDPSGTREPIVFNKAERNASASNRYRFTQYYQDGSGQQQIFRIYPTYLLLVNNYYLSGTASGGVSGEDLTGEAEPKSAAALKKMATTLGEAYIADTGINGGYPILRWQAGQNVGSDYSFTVVPNVAGASVTVTDALGNSLSPGSDGIYTTLAGAPCLYRVEAEGYLPETGCVTGREGSTVCVALTENNLVHQLVLNTDVADATLSLKYYNTWTANWSNERRKNENGNFELYALNKYQYTVSAEGYDDITGEFTAGYEDMTITANFKGDAPAIIYGDLNGDEKVNIFDLVAMRRHLSGTEFLTDGLLPAADVTKDGKVNIFDLVRMRQFLAGIIQSL